MSDRSLPRLMVIQLNRFIESNLKNNSRDVNYVIEKYVQEWTPEGQRQILVVSYLYHLAPLTSTKITSTYTLLLQIVVVLDWICLFSLIPLICYSFIIICLSNIRRQFSGLSGVLSL